MIKGPSKVYEQARVLGKWSPKNSAFCSKHMRPKVFLSLLDHGPFDWYWYISILINHQITTRTRFFGDSLWFSIHWIKSATEFEDWCHSCHRGVTAWHYVVTLVTELSSESLQSPVAGQGRWTLSQVSTNNRVLMGTPTNIIISAML